MTSTAFPRQEAVFHNILVLTSDPPASDVALLHCVHLVARQGGTLHLAHRDWIAAGDGQPQRTVSDLLFDWNLAAAHLRALGASCALRGVRHRVHMSPCGRRADLAALVRRQRIDLVALANPAASPSDAAGVCAPLGAAGCPILLFGPGVVVEAGAWPMQRVLCACDFSAAADGALEYACRLAARSGGGLLAAHVVESRAHGDPLRIAEAESGLRELLTGAVRAGVRAQVAVLAGEPAEVVARLARDRHADLIVLGLAPDTLASPGHQRATAWSIVHSAACPVLLVPESAPRQSMSSTGWGYGVPKPVRAQAGGAPRASSGARRGPRQSMDLAARGCRAAA